jgi:hypothetical protein
MSRVVVFFIVVILAGCSPQRRLARIFDRHPDLMAVDTVIHDTIIYRDTTIYVLLPGDTVEVEVALEVPVDLPDTTIATSTDYSRAEAGLQDNVLWLTLVQTDTIVEIVLDSVLVEKEVEKVVTQTVTVETGISLFWRHGFLVLGGLILVGLILFFLLRKR